jgi:23S rRNA (adenine-N6)-dimethyltransferase
MARNAASRTRRVFGQNFLADDGAVQHLIMAAGLPARGLVYEIGAGRGRLTRALLAPRRHVVAFEVDPVMAAALPRRPGLEVRTTDFLTARPPGESFDVVGNIPYALTAAVVDWCLHAPALRTATLLTQWEYARKRTGGYGRWTRLTIATWPEFDWEPAGRIPRTAFRPVPRVDGGLLRLVRRPVPLVGDLVAYRKVVDLGFAGVGGSLQASLARRFGRERTAAAFRAVRVAPDLPVGMVWPEQWLTLYRLLTAQPHRGHRSTRTNVKLWR